MADSKISNLSAATSLADSDEFVIASSGTTKKITAVVANIRTGFGTALPGSPADGDEYILTDSVTAPTYTWRFRYVSAKASNKWVFLGGPPLLAQSADNTPQSTSSITYTDLSTSGPAVTLPVTGDYQVEIGFTGDGGVATGLSMSYAIGGSAAVDADMVQTASDSSNERLSAHRVKFKSGLGAVTLTAKYRNSDSAGTIRFYNRYIAVIPVAVGG